MRVTTPDLYRGASEKRRVDQGNLRCSAEVKLSWDSHIDMICKKTSAGIGAMRRIKPFVPVDTLDISVENRSICRPIYIVRGVHKIHMIQQFFPPNLMPDMS